MTVSSLFYKSVGVAGRGLTAAFNRISGNKALADRGLVRASGNTLAGAAGLTLSSMAPLLVAACLTPVVGLPLAAIFATAAAVGGVLVPARLEATAIIHAADRKKINPPKDIVANDPAEAVKKKWVYSVMHLKSKRMKGV